MLRILFFHGVGYLNKNQLYKIIICKQEEQQSRLWLCLYKKKTNLMGNSNSWKFKGKFELWKFEKLSSQLIVHLFIACGFLKHSIYYKRAINDLIAR